MSKIDFEIDAGSVRVSAGGRDYVKLEIEDMDTNELIDAVGISEILAEINYEDIVENVFDKNILLDQFTKKEVIEYFDIEEKEQL